MAEHVPNASVDLIKLDTESTEPAALRGLESTIGRHRPAVVCEVLRDRTEPELEAFFFGQVDYDAYWLTPDGPQGRSRIVGDPEFRYVNYLFVPSGSALPAPR